MKFRVAAQASLVAISLALAACGGGGGTNSTPPPTGGGGGTPTPSPSPSPSPSPTPTPTPPPTGVNATLEGTLQSETFANRTANATVNFTANDSTGTITNSVTATIIYDAASDTYRLTTPTGTQSFGPAQLDASRSNALTRVYSRTSGSTTDTLTLTRAGSGGISFSYVGSAFWQRTTQNTSTVDGSIDASVYGVITPNAAVPRTGEASYGITTYGAYTIQNNLFPLAGSGDARIDFASGTIFLVGEMVIADGNPGRVPFSFSGNGSVSSTANSFSGSFEFTDFQTYRGQFNGAFFGPQAQELGGAWTAGDGTGNLAVGTFLGKQGTTASNTQFNPANPGQPSLTNSDLFVVKEAVLDFDFNGNYQQNNTAGAFSNVSDGTGTLSIFYDADSDTYQLRTASGLSDRFNAGGGSIVGQPRGFSQWDRRDGLSYVQAGGWRYFNPDSPVGWRYSYHVFGFPTPGADMPRTGTAGYRLTFDGRMADPDYLNEYVITGNGALLANFGTSSLTLNGSMLLGENYILSGRANDTFTASVSGSGAISSTGSSFAGDVTIAGRTTYSGTFDGNFFGPAAEEVGGTIQARDANGALVATFVGVEDDTITNSGQTLAGATGPLSLTGYNKVGFSQDLVAVAYNPSSGSYTITFDPGRSATAVTLDSTKIDAGQSTSARTFYNLTGDPAASGFLATLGANNPEIALTYMTFGVLDVTSTACCNVSGRQYVVFGLETPSATLPRAGTGSYSGIVIGSGNNAATGYVGDISGTSTLLADFGAATLTLDLGLVQDNGIVIGNYVLNGQIANNGFFGGSSNQSLFSASLRGGFFGPNADEFGAVFDILQDDANGRSIFNGLTVGKKNPN